MVCNNVLLRRRSRGRVWYVNGVQLDVFLTASKGADGKVAQEPQRYTKNIWRDISFSTLSDLIHTALSILLALAKKHVEMQQRPSVPILAPSCARGRCCWLRQCHPAVHSTHGKQPWLARMPTTTRDVLLISSSEQTSDYSKPATNTALCVRWCTLRTRHSVLAYVIKKDVLMHV